MEEPHSEHLPPNESLSGPPALLDDPSFLCNWKLLELNSEAYIWALSIISSAKKMFAKSVRATRMMIE